MKGRLLDLAVEVLSGGTEVHWRGALGRAYYALMLECREALFRWGFKLPPRDNVHTWVRLRFTFPADPDLKVLGLALDRLGRLRNAADYDLATLPAFANDQRARDSVQEVTYALALVDAIDADPSRRLPFVAAIQKAFP
jgi:hypothetical protein